METILSVGHVSPLRTNTFRARVVREAGKSAVFVRGPEQRVPQLIMISIAIEWLITGGGRGPAKAEAFTPFE